VGIFDASLYCLENLPNVIMIPSITGHHVAGSITGDLVVRCQRISIIPKLQHPCAHLWPSPLNNSSISSGLTALSSGDSWPESRTIIPWTEMEQFKFLLSPPFPLLSAHIRRTNLFACKSENSFYRSDISYFGLLLKYRFSQKQVIMSFR